MSRSTSCRFGIVATATFVTAMATLDLVHGQGLRRMGGGMPPRGAQPGLVPYRPDAPAPDIVFTCSRCGRVVGRSKTGSIQDRPATCPYCGETFINGGTAGPSSPGPRSNTPPPVNQPPAGDSGTGMRRMRPRGMGGNANLPPPPPSAQPTVPPVQPAPTPPPQPLTPAPPPSVSAPPTGSVASPSVAPASAAPSPAPQSVAGDAPSSRLVIALIVGLVVLGVLIVAGSVALVCVFASGGSRKPRRRRDDYDD